MNILFKVMLFGYYGVGELCDDFMATATKQTFEELSKRTIQWVSPGEPADLIILGGGSLLGDNLYLDQLCNILAHTDCPFAIFGTGVRDIETGAFLPRLQYLWDRAAFVSVRGETSWQRLHLWGIDTSKIQFLGDPIFLSSPLGLEKKGYIGGVIRPTPICPPARMKAAFDYLHAVRNQPVKLFSFCEPQLDGATNKASGYDSYVFDAVQTRKGIAEASFWFGNRLHAFCLALIEGVPAIGVEIEFRKVEDVCSTLNYPYFTYGGYPIEHTYYHLMQDWDTKYIQVQERIAVIRRGLRSRAQHILEMV